MKQLMLSAHVVQGNNSQCMYSPSCFPLWRIEIGKGIMLVSKVFAMTLVQNKEMVYTFSNLRNLGFIVLWSIPLWLVLCQSTPSTELYSSLLWEGSNIYTAFRKELCHFYLCSFVQELTEPYTVRRATSTLWLMKLNQKAYSLSCLHASNDTYSFPSTCPACARQAWSHRIY